jgi:2-keto-4-pentenoate hydratase/2-oxohepta-3-ene-1,7-dioic acid hydratase in catechol pathway
VRIAHVPDEGFLVRAGADGWVPVATLGVPAPDTPALIRRWPLVRAALAAGRGTPRSAAFVPGPPVVAPGKILAVGLNYRDHAEELGVPMPEVPKLFLKTASTLCGPSDPLLVDGAVTAVVVGRRTRHVPAAQALESVFGYLVADDVTARDLQRDPALAVLAKNLDGSCPVGPWITTADEVPDPQALTLTCEVDGVVRQRGTTADMLFGVAELVAQASRYLTLEPGDLLLTGTPAGVGAGARPPRYLADGSVVRCRIEGLGELSNRVAFAHAGSGANASSRAGS